MLSRLTLLMFSVVLTGCASSVYTDYSSQFNFNAISSFELARQSSTSAISLDDNRIQKALTTELVAKGLTPSSEADSADVTVQYAIVPKTENVAYGSSFSFGYGFRHVGVAASTPVRYEERSYGQLVIEMINTKTDEVVWKASSKRKLTESMTPENRRTFIQEQIVDMFEQYPPKPGA
ncbi:DUF4136 domain-containing protein [Enterovibrio baiacu]|uniref:DUF4136 domain-containing protein n=1 Tax=Enterovibrio baiacu TaxID=2491023 RepID=UPI001012EC2E|nr:DUF4136 domain-containing protein [Enterovibrio baiacu]MBE1275386.1 DUF4136 domain-containing protein [Enterovibrio baiacu]